MYTFSQPLNKYGFLRFKTREVKYAIVQKQLRVNTLTMYFSDILLFEYKSSDIAFQGKKMQF